MARSIAAESDRPQNAGHADVKLNLEDLAGRTFMLLWFTVAVAGQTMSLIKLLSHGDGSPTWMLNVVHSLLLILFSTVAVALTVLRRPTKIVASGLEPRISAILGTYSVLTISLLPTVNPGAALEAVAVVIMVIGAGLSVYCLIWLGQSYSIMAAARKLVTGGPYRFVRHPLYAAELLTIFGIALANFSLPAVLIFAATAAFQLRRSVNEERVLRAAFPEYEEYARAVPRIIPRLPWSRRPAIPAELLPEAH